MRAHRRQLRSDAWWCNDTFGALVRAARHDGTLRLSPSLAGRGHIVALPGVLCVSADAAPEDPTMEG